MKHRDLAEIRFFVHPLQPYRVYATANDIEGTGRTVEEAVADLQYRLDPAKRDERFDAAMASLRER
jgi:hypothetical protein